MVHDYGFTDARARVSWGRKWSAASQFDDGSINDDNVPQSGGRGRALPDVGRRDDILIITREDTTGQRLPMRQKVIRETRFSIN